MNDPSGIEKIGEDTDKHGLIASSDDPTIKDEIDADILQVVEFETMRHSGHHEVITADLVRVLKGVEKGVFGKRTSRPEVRNISGIDLIYLVDCQIAMNVDPHLSNPYC